MNHDIDGSLTDTFDGAQTIDNGGLTLGCKCVAGAIDIGRETIDAAGTTSGTVDFSAATSVTLNVNDVRVGTAVQPGGNDVGGSLILSTLGANAITASTLAAPLMPVTVICFLVLMNRKDYMGEATPVGGMRLLWNAALIVVAIALTVNAWFALKTNWGKLQDYLNPPDEAALLSPVVEPTRDDSGGQEPSIGLGEGVRIE